MARLLYVLAHSTDDPRRSATALATAAAGARSHDVALWLTDEGVRLAVKGVSDALVERGPRPATESLEALREAGAVLHVSRPCFEARGFAEEALRDESRLADPEALARLLADGWIPVPT